MKFSKFEEKKKSGKKYAAMASLRAGGELASVFTSPEASQPIKCYSPELMVVPSYDITGWEERLHVLGISGFSNS